MTELQVSVLQVLSEKSFGSIFSARVVDFGSELDGATIRIRARAREMAGAPAVGELWRVAGEIRETSFGVQLEAHRAVRETPSGQLIVSFLAKNVAGIGVERAQRLWREWGPHLAGILSDEANIPLLAAVIAPERPNLGPAMAAACCKRWSESKALTQTYLWLEDKGISDSRVANRLAALLGEAAVEAIEFNPYMLVALLPWAKVDALGLRLAGVAGIADPRLDPRRLVGAVDAAVKSAIQSGSTALDEIGLRDGTAKCLGRVRHSAAVDLAINLGVAEGAVLVSDKGWRAPGCAAIEEQLVAALQLLVERGGKSPVELPDRELLARVLATFRISGHLMHSEQQYAVLELLQRPLACLQGGAGVGKTTTLLAVCELWEGSGGQVVLCTVAGKAALRLSKATHRLAMTLARLLSQLRERESIEAELLGTEAGRNDRLADLIELTPGSLVVVDEASMLDLPSAHDLVRRLPPGSRLLLVGDEAQLPPVGFGLVYHKLVDDPKIAIRLTTVHRQASDSPIPRVAASIRHGECPSIPPFEGCKDGISLLVADLDCLQSEVVRVWDELGGRQSNTLICTATKGGVAGVNALNQVLQRRHAERSGLAAIRGYFSHWYCPGDPVVWLRNDYRRGLCNGLLGQVLSVHAENDGLVVKFEDCDDPTELGTEDLIDLALGYAITCHKAQGSQAPRIIVPLYANRVLDPSWLYTAITRAERQAVLVGKLDVLKSALLRPWAARNRRVGFDWART